MDPDEPVVVYTTNTMAEAEMVRNLLRAEGIVCEASGENQGGFPGAGVMEISILTHAADADRARQIIEQHHSKPAEE
jgi:hypothetical protein